MPLDPTRLLENLVYDAKTRVGGEFYLYYNLGKSFKYGSIGVTAPGERTFRKSASCAAQDTPPVSGVYVARASTAIKSGADITFSVQGRDAIIGAYYPPGQSSEFSGPITDPVSEAQTSVTGGVAGDSIDIIALPNPSGDVLVCYDNGLTAEIADEVRAIPRKFDAVDHYVRQRSANTISLSELYVCNLTGLSLLRNRDVVLIGKFYPDGGAVPSEIIYYTGVRLNVPSEIPAETNDSVTVNANGSFRDKIVFSAPPA